MSNLKIKFSAFEGYVAMQILEQSEKFTSTSKTDLKNFSTSQGVVFVSEGKPSLSINNRKNNPITIGLRGFSSSDNLNVEICRIPTGFDMKSPEIIERISKAIYELSDQVASENVVIDGSHYTFANFDFQFAKFNNTIVVEIVDIAKHVDNRFSSEVKETGMYVSFDGGDDLVVNQFSKDGKLTANFGTKKGEPGMLTFADNQQRDTYFDKLIDSLKVLDLKISKSMEVAPYVSDMGDIVITI